MFQVRMQDENGLAFFLEGGSFCLGLHPKTSKKPSSKGQVAISWHPFNQAVHDGSAGSPPRLVKQQQPTPDGQSPHDYAMDCGNPLKVLFWNQTLIHISTGVDLRFFSANFLYGMQQLTKKKLVHVSMSKIALGFRHPPTSLEERLTESCSIQFDACLILPKTPRIHCKLKNSPRILQVTFLKGKSGRIKVERGHWNCWRFGTSDAPANEVQKLQDTLSSPSQEEKEMPSFGSILLRKRQTQNASKKNLESSNDSW